MNLNHGNCPEIKLKEMPIGIGKEAEMVDKLEHIYSLQWNLQKRLYKTETQDSLKDMDYIKLNILAVENELHEALRETPWKPWKQNQEFNTEKFKEELIDALHFFINLCLASGMGPNELYYRYLQKNKINHERQDNNY